MKFELCFIFRKAKIDNSNRSSPSGKELLVSKQCNFALMHGARQLTEFFA
jgi:hypothetical protein